MQGWERCANVIASAIRNGGFDRDVIDALLNDAELWVRRSNVLMSGEVKLYRFYGSRASAVPF